MQLYPIKTKTVTTDDNLVDVILKSVAERKFQLEENDILALTSKVVAHAANCIVNLKTIKASTKAEELAQRFSLQKEFVELILQKADKIYGGVPKTLLTLKDSVLMPNAGIDKKNAPFCSVVVLPNNLKEWAYRIKEEISFKTGKKIAVLIVDSGLTPLRIGTTGLALAVAGFKPVKDYRGSIDLYGKGLAITRHAIADDLASAAHLLMREANEKIPAVLVRDAPVVFNNQVYGSEDMVIPGEECVFWAPLLSSVVSQNIKKVNMTQ